MAIPQDMKIEVRKNGPYVVHGNIPLVHKTQVVSELGEPLTWKKDGDIPTPEGDYELCRCGKSETMPFCDGNHVILGFDGTEAAKTNTAAERMKIIRGSTNIIVKKDPHLCMDSGFCGMAGRSLSRFVAATDDTEIRSLVIAMVERCPAGALVYQIDPTEPEIEPDLPPQIAVTVEITSDGPIEGPLWVSGGIPVARADHEPFETRNRVTLCNCGLSRIKPLCDGTHRHEAEKQAREKKRSAG